MPNIELSVPEHVTNFRKIAIGTWRTAYDPSVYGTIELRMEKALAYIEAFRARTGKRLTITQMVTKAVAEALKACPEANAILRFNRIYLRRDVNLSVLVVQTDNGKVDLTAAKVNNVDQKSLLQLVDEMEATVARVRARQDKAVESGKSTVKLIPFFLMNHFLDLLSFVMYTLNLDLSALGMPKDPFGGCVVTNVGSLGLDVAYVPLSPYTRAPIFLAPGAIKDKPVVEDGKVVVGKVMSINATFDHRFIDGYHASVLSKTLHRMFEDPFATFDRIESLPEGQPAPAALAPAADSAPLLPPG
jgi:pyruvate dehydrogenase E2 component (dihydrolipoamide acetyltransferase)